MENQRGSKHVVVVVFDPSFEKHVFPVIAEWVANNHKEFGVWNRGYTFGSGEYCILFDSIPPDDVSGIFQALVGPPFHSLRKYEEKPSSQKERVLELAREGLSVDDIAESLWFEFGEYLPNGSLRPWQIRRILNTGLGKKAVASV